MSDETTNRTWGWNPDSPETGILKQIVKELKAEANTCKNKATSIVIEKQSDANAKADFQLCSSILSCIAVALERAIAPVIKKDKDNNSI